MFIIKMIGSIGHIYIYNEIDQHWGFSLSQLSDQLAKLDPNTELHVHINSIGGSVQEGIGIYNRLRSWKGKVVTINEGFAASIASIIFLAGQERQQYDNAFVMIHDPMLGGIGGNKEELKEAVDLLEKVSANVKSIYKSKITATDAELEVWLAKDSYFDADESLKLGFATKIISIPETKASANLEALVARLSSQKNTKGTDMKFQAWLEAQCKALELDAAKLSDAQKAHFQSQYDAQNAPPAPGPTAKLTKDSTELAADEIDRQAAIEMACEEIGLSTKLDADALKREGITSVSTVRGVQSHALRNKWSRDKLELVLRRAQVVDAGPTIHTKSGAPKISESKALAVALLRNSGVMDSMTNKNGKEYGVAHWYDEKTLEAADHPDIRDISLLGIYDMMYAQATGHRYSGRLNTDGFLSACRETISSLRASGNTIWTGLNIFNDVANKTLLAAYESQATTWQEWVHQRPVADFKTSNMYRLTMKGGYQEVGADGELKHGGFSDTKFTHSAETYGKIVGLTRKDLINDDLGALNGIMTGLGMEAALFLEELFYAQLLGQLATLFPTNDSLANYFSGASSALSVDSLSTGEQKFSDQVTADYAPILQSPDLLLTGTANRVVARELYTKTSLDVLQTANAKGRPNENPHVGKFRPVISPYFNNTALKRRVVSVGSAFTGQSSTAWLLLKSPNAAMGGIIIGSFLNGKTTPVIEQSDADFSVLGQRWRAYHDAGADNGDPKLGVMSKGAA